VARNVFRVLNSTAFHLAADGRSFILHISYHFSPLQLSISGNGTGVSGFENVISLSARAAKAS
jgi:hypothetical protein